jgi:hypothetical protein
MKRVSSSLGCTVAGLLLAACTLSASAQRHWFVAPSGSDAGNECQDSNAPCATIAHVLTRVETNSLQPGDTLHLAAGVYTESSLVLTRDLDWAGAGADVTIVQAAAAAGSATDRVATISSGASSRFTGLTIRHGRTPDGADGGTEAAPGGNGGGLLVNGTLELVSCRVVSNQTGRGGIGDGGGRGGDGGGIYNDGTLVVSNSVVAYNRTGDGGAATNEGSRAGNGWGIHNTGTLRVYGSAVHHNLGGDGGAAADNGGDAGCGALWNSGDLRFINSTLSDNTGGFGGAGTNGVPGLDSQGGGLWNAVFGGVLLAHATVAGNSASGGGDDLFTDGAAVTASHVVVAGGLAGAVEVAGPSLLAVTNDAVLSGDTGGVISGQDPLLGELAMLGGLAPVRRLKPLSPAVNAGDPAITNAPDTDQRGAPRIQGGRIDLGAYELQPAVSYVSETGTDGTNECRASDAPCASLAHAIPQALPGDTIVITTGTLTEAGIELDRPLTLMGNGATVSIWQAAADVPSATDRLLAIPSGITVTVQALTLRHGRAPDGVDAEAGGSGGAILNEGALYVEACEFRDNRAGDGGPDGGEGGRGGAIYSDGLLWVDQTRFVSNRAGNAGDAGAPGGSGGAVYNAAQAQMADVEFANNRCGDGTVNEEGGHGGGFANGGVATVAASTFADNTAGSGGPGGTGGRGGGFFNEDTMTAIHLTVSGNRSGPGGRAGGISNEGALTLLHSTVAYNEAQAPGGAAGGLDSAGLFTALGHVILSDNLADGGGPDGEGDFNSLGYNLVSDDDGLTLTNVAAGNLTGVSALLAPLADNGGFTRTHMPGDESPVREAGDPSFAPPPATDQRGMPRVVGPRIDLGAVEPTLADVDGDGLPDYWETLYGLDRYDPGLTNIFAGAGGDPDEDQADHWSEYVADTNPTNAQSVFRITALQSHPALTLQFPSSAFRLYSVQAADPAVAPAWSNLTGLVDVPGSGTTHTVVLPAPATGALFRLTVRLP